jgi:hypothetical protein
LLAVFEATVSIIAMLLNKPVLGVDSAALVDATFFTIIAFGLHKKSRVAGIVGLILYVTGRMSVAVTSHSVFISIATVILILCFIHGIRGTFAYRKLTEKKQLQRRSAANEGC